MAKYVQNFIVYFLILSLSANALGKTLPSYIHVCKRNPETLNKCVMESIESLRPRLAKGLPELKVPGIEPFIIHEFVVDPGNEQNFKAVGRDVKVYGASNFKIKYLDVDVEKNQIKTRIMFPRLHLEGKYDIDANILSLPIHGRGDITSNSKNCVADVILKGIIERRNGGDYMKITGVDLSIDIEDYTIKVTNLFNGNSGIDDLANQIINTNKADVMKSTKPYLERSVSGLIKKIANKIINNYSLDEILPIE